MQNGRDGGAARSSLRAQLMQSRMMPALKAADCPDQELMLQLVSDRTTERRQARLTGAFGKWHVHCAKGNFKIALKVATGVVSHIKNTRAQAELAPDSLVRPHTQR